MHDHRPPPGNNIILENTTELNNNIHSAGPNTNPPSRLIHTPATRFLPAATAEPHRRHCRCCSSWRRLHRHQICFWHKTLPPVRRGVRCVRRENHRKRLDQRVSSRSSTDLNLPGWRKRNTRSADTNVGSIAVWRTMEIAVLCQLCITWVRTATWQDNLVVEAAMEILIKACGKNISMLCHDICFGALSVWNALFLVLDSIAEDNLIFGIVYSIK